MGNRLPPRSAVFPNIPRYTYFKAKTVYTGSKGDMRFRIEPFDEIKVYIWHSKMCFEKSEIDAEATFPQSAEGYEQMINYLEEYSEKDETSKHPRWEKYEGWSEEFVLNYENEVARDRENGIFR